MYTNKWDSPGRYGYSDHKKDDGLVRKKIINTILNVLILIFSLVLILCAIYLISYGFDINMVSIIISSAAIIINAFTCKNLNRLS